MLSTPNIKTHIDINCDMGEGINNEPELMPYISSCNIACGGHAGDETTMRVVSRLAKRHGVKVGAHPSYPDREYFGRKVMHLPNDELRKSIRSQINQFAGILHAERIRMHHIKPHGALYNTIAKDRNLAIVFLEAIEDFRAESILYVPPNSQVANEADRRGFRIRYEAFGDRNYNNDLTLVSRKLPNAMIKEPEKVFEHVSRMVFKGYVTTVRGENVPIAADTFCIHGDTDNALQILLYLTNAFSNHGIQFKK